MNKQLPYFERVAEEDRPGLNVQERDLKILETVMNHRFISSTQLKALLWWIPENSLQDRLKKLYHHKFLNRPKDQRVLRIMDDFSQMVYSLDDRGVKLLANHLGIDKNKIKWQVNSAESSYLRHSLMISEFRICLTLATQTPEERAEKRLRAWKQKYEAKRGNPPSEATVNLKGEKIEREEKERREDMAYRFYKKSLDPGVELVSWKKGKQVADTSFYKDSSGSREKFPVSPDGYFELRFTNKNKADSWFLEADRGTMSGKRFNKKLKSYWNYKVSRSGRRARREQNRPNFRVLTITEDEERRDYLKKVVRQSDLAEKSYGSFWFGTESDYQLEEPETIFERNFIAPRGDEERSLLPER